MANKLKSVLPLLRERAAYIKDDGTGNDNSDYINKSFKGILRLSPNDSNSYLEQNSYISFNDITSEFISFEDNITNQFKNQFIRVSTSDGHLLDLRVSIDGVEYDNLYILGGVSTNAPLNLYATDKKSFKIGNSFIVSERNKNSFNTVKNKDKYVPIQADNIEDTFILVNMGNGMEFVNATNIIGTFIREALMELAAVPSGSIQFIPVNLEQYKALLAKSKGHNVVSDSNDSLIRDYLLCDGSYYRVDDFPELAKVLYKEKINYWKASYDIEETGDVAIKNFSLNYDDNDNIDEKEIYVGKELIEETVRVFRVPDLRGSFLQSVVPGFNSSEITGDFTIDSNRNQEFMIKHGLDEHYHYMVLDHHEPWRDNTVSGHLRKIIDESKEGYYSQLVEGTYGATLARHGGIIAKRDGPLESTTQECTGCREGRGRSGIYYPTEYNYYCIYSGTSGGYIFSTLNPEMDKKTTSYTWRGVSSWTINMAYSTKEIENKKNEIELNYTNNPNDPVYKNGKKEYVDYFKESSKTHALLGYENSPEFYAVLPLIKI